MAHFASLNSDNIVTDIIAVDNTVITDDQGQEQEALGIEFCQNLFGDDTHWVQTSYNNNFRKRYAGIGFKYEADLDAFIAPKPYPSWLFNEVTLDWDPPVPMPEDYDVDTHYPVWNEETRSWEIKTIPPIPQ